MKKIVSLLTTNQLYFLSLCLLLLAALCIAGIYGTTALSIPLHAAHPSWLNIFFINYTFMGDGFFALVLAAFFFFYLKKRETGLYLFTAFVFTEGIVQFFKNAFASSGIQLVFEDGQYLFFREESTIFNISSVISGHTAVAFAIATVFIIRMSKKSFQFPVLIAAVLMGISRMYLAQELIPEIVVGAFTGTASAVMVSYLIQQMPAIPGQLKNGIRYRVETLQAGCSMHKFLRLLM